MKKPPLVFGDLKTRGGFFILIRPKAENFQDLNRFSSRKRSETSENDVFEAKINSLEAGIQKNSRLRRAEYCFPWLYMISDWFSPLCVSEVTSELIIRGVRTCNRKKAPQARKFLFEDMKNIDFTYQKRYKSAENTSFWANSRRRREIFLGSEEV